MDGGMEEDGKGRNKGGVSFLFRACAAFDRTWVARLKRGQSGKRGGR